MVTKVVMPKLGESVVEGTVVKWLYQEGDHVEEFESLIEVESAKVSTEIPSPASGTLLKILVGDGVTVKAGTIIAWLGEEGDTIPEEDESQESDLKLEEADDELQSEQTREVKREQDQSAIIKANNDRDIGFISPVVARMVKEHNLDLYQIEGSGKDGRITKKDVLAYLETVPKVKDSPEMAAWETPGEGDLFRPAELQFPERFVPEKTGIKSDRAIQNLKDQPQIGPAGDQLIPHTTMRKTIANHMVRSKQISPHVTTVMEADMKQVELHRKKNKSEFSKQQINLTFTAYFAAATIVALKAFPIVNSSWTEEGILLKQDVNLGLAASLGEGGLIVPVIKQADRYSLFGLARSINELTARARNRKLTPDDVQGGTFTITNHGTSGSLFASPIINQPECAILGVGVIKKRVVVIDDAIAIRPMVYLSLTFDHRILDGSAADSFLAKVVEELENWK
jgi:2-oxoglutarate dehydrogenase E2 component (dihydrolipoamide succinyltransferase)